MDEGRKRRSWCTSYSNLQSQINVQHGRPGTGRSKPIVHHGEGKNTRKFHNGLNIVATPLVNHHSPSPSKRFPSSVKCLHITQTLARKEHVCCFTWPPFFKGAIFLPLFCSSQKDIPTVSAIV